MTDLRAAAQQALEALEIHSAIKHPQQRHYRDSAIEALRAALAEPDLSRCPNCKGPADNGHDRCIPPNVYWCTKCMTEYFGSNPPKPSEEVQSTHSEECYKWHHECAIAEVESLREELAEAYTEMRKMTEQVESAKPVAWMHTNGVGQVYFRKKPQDKVFNPQPVYLHPKTLTDEDISVLWHQSGEQPFKFARMLLK